MLLGLLITAFVMGLLGSPHCLVMCGALSCAALQQVRAGIGGQSVLTYHGARMFSYTLLGALAGGAVASLRWGAQHVLVIKPLWIFFHVLVLVWGAVMLLSAKQPEWLQRGLVTWWRRWRGGSGGNLDGNTGGNLAPTTALAENEQPLHFSPRPSRALGVGLAWGLLPCGLLYSALMIAAVTGVAWQGGAVMLSFALGTASGLGLVYITVRSGAQIKPEWVRKWQARDPQQQWIIRCGGVVLMAMSAWSIWRLLSTQTLAAFCA